MSQMEPQNSHSFPLLFPAPTKLSVWDKWLEQQIFRNPYNHSNESTLKHRIIKEYYGWREGLWTDYHTELVTNGTPKT